MTISLLHAFHNPVADEGDPNVTGPDEWNAEHLLSQASSRILGRVTAGTGATEELTAAQVVSFLGRRLRLTGDATVYVRADGSEDNDGSANTAGGAWLLPQTAAHYVCREIDTNGFDVDIVLTGAFTTGMVFDTPIVGGGTVTVTTLTSASITTTSDNGIYVAHGARVTVSGAITFSTVTSGISLLAGAGGYIENAGGMTFGAAAGGDMQAGWNAPVGTDAGGGTIDITGAYTIATGNHGSHIHATSEGSHIHYPTAGVTVTLTGTPAFVNFFAGITKGQITVSNVTWSGSATGIRYFVHNGGSLVGAASRTSLPGNAAGVTSAGGDYIVSDNDSDFGMAYGVARAVAARATPVTNYGDIYIDSTDKRLHDKNDAGTIGTTVVADTGASNQFLTAISAAGVVSKAQPSLSNISGYGTGVLTALGINVGSAGAPVLFNGALGTPSSGTVTNLTGTASININGTVGATTPNTVAATSLTATSVTFTGGTLANAATVSALTATQPASPATSQDAIVWTVTSNGSAAQINRGFFFTYAAGYTGSAQTAALSFSNAAAGTSSGVIPASGGNSFTGNIGIRGTVTGTTTGTNIGASLGASGGDINVGITALAQVAKNSAVNIGGAFSAINTGTSPVHVGLWTSLNRTTTPSQSAALIADNGAQSDPVARFKVAGTDKVVIDANGILQVPSFTVGTLPSGITGGMVWASNCRVFNGAGTQEGAGTGTGGLVTYNGSAWKIAGTNVTAVA